MNKSVAYMMPLLLTYIVSYAIVQSLIQVASSNSPSFARVQSSIDIRTETQKVQSSSRSLDFETRKENACKLWEERRYTEAAKKLSALWTERMARKTNTYDKQFVAVARCLANVYRDMGAFKSALQCHKAILSYEQRCFKPNDARLAVDYNNVGLCHYLLGEVADSEASRAQAFRSALAAYRRAETIWLNGNFDSPNISLNLRNQFIANIELKDEQQATAIKQRIRILAEGTNHSSAPSGGLELATFIGALIPAKKTH